MEHQHWTPTPQPMQNDDFFDFSKTVPQNSIVPVPPQQLQQHQQQQQQQQMSSYDQDTLKQLKQGFEQMMQKMERLESRMNKIEQNTNSILKNQQEVLTTPFMSQEELDRARKAAEQLEQDTSVAKQLQAAYNKETEVRRTVNAYSNTIGQCPICGVSVRGSELESHVDKCLQVFSNDPKKEKEVRETKTKVEQGFFSRLYKTTESKKTKVISNVPPTNSSTGLSEQHEAPMMVSPQGYYPGYPAPMYPPYMAHPGGSPQPQHSMMMPGHMPMYMYPSYPGMNGSQSEH